MTKFCKGERQVCRSSRSIAPKGENRVDPGRSTCRHVTGEQPARSKQAKRAGKSNRIRSGNAVENAREHSRCQERGHDPQAAADGKKGAPLPKDQCHHSPGLRPERHPQAELTRPLRDVVCDGAVEADRRQDERRDREAVQQLRDEPQRALSGGAHGDEVCTLKTG